MTGWRGALVAVVLGAWAALAQGAPVPPAPPVPTVVPEREVQITKATFDAGRFAEALERAKAALAQSGFSDAQRIELFRVAALSAFNLNDERQARSLFFSLLQLDPDYVLDPFAVPPPAIAAFEQVRSDNAATLNVSRQLIAFKAEKERREKAEAEKVKAAQVATRVIERRSAWVNLLPFGVPQFQQGRYVAGGLYGGAQAALGIASLVGFAAVQSLMTTQTWRLTDQKGADNVEVKVRGTPAAVANLAMAYSAVQVGAGIGFYVMWAVMMIDGFINHRPEAVLETKPAALTITPVPGGAAAQLTFRIQ